MPHAQHKHKYTQKSALNFIMVFLRLFFLLSVPDKKMQNIESLVS